MVIEFLQKPICWVSYLISCTPADRQLFFDRQNKSENPSKSVIRKQALPTPDKASQTRKANQEGSIGPGSRQRSLPEPLGHAIANPPNPAFAAP